MADSQRIEVAVGVIRQDDQVLLAWRHAQQAQGACWEFPGGKLEAGESPAQALSRELLEELGITVKQAQPWGRLDFDYPERRVRLHILRVETFEGEPVGREGQALQWLDCDQLGTVTLPAANRPIMRWLQLPDIYAVLPPDWACRDRRQRDQALAGLPAGTGVYCRLKEWPAGHYRQEVAYLIRTFPKLKWFGAAAQPVVTGLTGLHLDSQALAAGQTAFQTSDNAISLSNLVRVAAIHDEGQLQQAQQCRVDAVVISPVQATASHEGAVTLGQSGWLALQQQAGCPAYGMGGLGWQDQQWVRAAGGQGIAGISFWLPSVTSTNDRAATPI